MGEVSRRNFLSVIGGAFAAAIVPGELPKLLKQVAAEKVIPPFPIALVQVRHYSPDPMQAVLPFKAFLNHGPMACECGWVGTGLWASGCITEEELDKAGGKEAALHLCQQKKLTLIQKLEDLWNESHRTGRLIHSGCPLRESV